MYWSFGSFLFTEIFLLVFFVLSIFAVRKNSLGSSTAILVISVLLMLAVLIGYAGDHQDSGMKQHLLDEINGVASFDDVAYHKVEYLGVRPVVDNPADGHFYVDLENGAMISFDRIFIEKMCRSCAQFKQANKSDKVHMYRVQREPKGTFNDDSPALLFSKEQDIYLQSMQSIIVNEQVKK